MDGVFQSFALTEDEGAKCPNKLDDGEGTGWCGRNSLGEDEGDHSPASDEDPGEGVEEGVV